MMKNHKEIEENEKKENFVKCGILAHLIYIKDKVVLTLCGEVTVNSQNLIGCSLIIQCYVYRLLAW